MGRLLCMKARVIFDGEIVMYEGVIFDGEIMYEG